MAQHKGSFSLPPGLFRQICSVFIKFPKHKKLSKDSRQSRNEGGIAILVPDKQHAALQLL